MELKRYQAETLAVLRRFLEEARVAGPARAFDSITREPAQAVLLGRVRGDYVPLEAAPATPYVCLRLPTGGGKTILAAHAVGVARDAWMERDFPLVLWLVPSTTIRKQTAEALRNTRHPYRQALDGIFESRVRVFDIGDFTAIRPHDIRDNACVVVATIQTLRVRDTEGRRVYAHNEDMEPHFSAIPANTPGLEQRDGGTGANAPKFSFANLLHVHRPLMMVDEAHNAVSGLTREMQARVAPCAIIEFTATPRDRSNILHSVTAQALRDENMIKLPIVLAEHDSWQNAVCGAIARRAVLAQAAAGEDRYVRPIVLFQAQKKPLEVTPEVLRRHLIEVERVAPERIAVVTGEQRELDGIDLFDPACPIEHVITVQALKEGWDCSFAYVFCSVSRIRSAVDVEQLLGRVLRMPYAARRRDAALNRAYAHVSEPSFGEAARALVDTLVGMGFDDREAEAMVEPAAQEELGGDGLFGQRPRPAPVFRYGITVDADASAALAALAGEAVAISAEADGRVEIVVSGHLSQETVAKIEYALPEAARAGFAERAEAYRTESAARLSAAERGEVFAVPRLEALVQGEFVLADSDAFMEEHEWSVLAYPARLSESEFAITETAHSFEIDLDGAAIAYRFDHEAAQLSLDVDVEGWSQEALVLWLAPQLRRSWTGHETLVRWLSDCVNHLTGPRRIRLPALMRGKFVLARVLRARLDAAERAERSAVFQHTLFGREASTRVSQKCDFAFRWGMYADVRMQRGGRWKPSRHFLGPDHMPAFDGAEGGEESQCAEVIDSLPAVAFWLRNVARHRESFWLPTASDKFYPDFVAKLTDGRLMVVEYKGELLAGHDDTLEKRVVGELWERCGLGAGLFLMVVKQVSGRDMRAQLRDKIGGAPVLSV